MSMFLTPLRYPGGKGRLGPWLAFTMRSNRVSGGTYVEPYAGGAGAALYLLINGYVRRLILNDIDPSIYAFWWSVLNEPEELIRRIETTPATIETWHAQRAVLASGDGVNQLDLGFATFFLNRTNRSGILNGGVVGGLEQAGKYTLQARYNIIDLVGRIRGVAKHKRQIALHNKDALQFLDTVSSDLPKRSLTYLDPPYFNKGQQLYRNFYTATDHANLARAAQSLQTPWLVTYDNEPQVSELYSKAKRCEFSLTYSSTTERQRATEQMFWGNLTLPMRPTLIRSPKSYPQQWDQQTTKLIFSPSTA